MRMKKHRRASIDEVRITREKENAIMEFADPAVSAAHFRLARRSPA